MKKIFLILFWRFICKEDIYWIVNDCGELGIKIFDRFFFIYKRELFEYENNPHEDGSIFKYRKIEKREFGESGPKSTQIPIHFEWKEIKLKNSNL